MPTKRRLVRGSYKNIIDCFDRANSSTVVEGAIWYKLANGWANVVGTQLSHHGHAKLDTRDERIVIGAGIISALSPQNSWEQNKTDAWRFGQTLEKPHWCTGISFNKARLIVESVQYDNPAQIIESILGGNKTKAFFRNILNPDGDFKPTIDRHAISVYLGRRCNKKELHRGLESVVTNDTISNAYIRASKELGCNYNELQAITWVQWRKEIKGEE